MALFLLPLNGCLSEVTSLGSEEILVWGKRGLGDGQFQTARAIAIDPNDQIYIVDKTGRIQVFDSEGSFIRGWRTPAIKNGKPCGLGIDNDGNLLVADTHYFRVLTYTPTGELLEEKTIGGQLGQEPGKFEFLTDVAVTASGEYFVAEYGDFDRVQVFDSGGNFLRQFGSHGSESDQFMRPQGIAFDKKGRLWVADACNHRIQVFDVSGDDFKLLTTIAEQGRGEGQVRYPYGIVIDDDCNAYVCEWGNHRIQKFSYEGESLGMWGGPGLEPGQMHQPWDVAMNSKGQLFVLDSYNNRVQRFQKF